MQQIDDVLPGLELHQGGAVVLAQLGEGGAHVPQHGSVVGLGEEPRRTLAEHLLLGQQLLVYLEADPQAHLRVVDRFVHGQGFPSRFLARPGDLSVIRQG